MCSTGFPNYAEFHLLYRKTTSTSTILTLITLNLGGGGCGLLAVLTMHKPHGRKKLNYSHASEL